MNSERTRFSQMDRNARMAPSHQGSPGCSQLQLSALQGLQRENLPLCWLTDKNLSLAIVLLNCKLRTLQFTICIDNNYRVSRLHGINDKLKTLSPRSFSPKEKASEIAFTAPPTPMKTVHVLKFSTCWGALLTEVLPCSSEHWDRISMYQMLPPSLEKKWHCRCFPSVLSNRKKCGNMSHK